jgi:VIT1/CCC1 family predicted Fe2+/Mn2+ transporter
MNDQRALVRQIQTEIDAAYLYEVLAKAEKDPTVAEIFREMQAIEQGHATAFAKKHGLDPGKLPGPSARARFLNRIGSVMGYGYVLGALLDTEKQLASAIQSGKARQGMPGSPMDSSHVSILRTILDRPGGLPVNVLSRFEKRHRSVGGNALRAAVLGGNDGLVSNFSLVMGVAGASSGQQELLLTGLAGMMAGALSMALGEWISVKSSQELYENQMRLEQEELETNPEGEEKELALIYRAKGIPEDQARAMAADVIRNPAQAHEVLIKEELGINAEELKGSAMEAALASFALFAVGAIIPVVPFFFTGGLAGVAWSAGLSAIGLFGIGSAITLFTGRSVWSSGLRQVVFGLAAAAITFAVGRVIGVSLAG